jgi:exodeoxyribonuclease VIII
MRNEYLKGLPAADYHKIEAFSASTAKICLRSAAHFAASKETQKEPSDAMKMGTAVHTAILEPHLFDAEIAIMPKFDKRTKAGKEGAEQFENDNVGKTVIDFYQGERVKAMAEAVRGHDFFKDHVKNGEAEGTMLWGQYGVQCKARVDYMVGQSIFDVKTCQDASPEGFSRQIASFGYHLQAAHYSMGFKRTFGEKLDRFVFIAVESNYPHMVGVYTLGLESLKAGQIELEKAAKVYAFALSEKPERTYSKRVMELNIPTWAMPIPFEGK